MRFPAQLQIRLDKWQLAVLILAAVYAFFLCYNLGYMSMQWDEVNHFNGALLLLRGQLWQYAAINSFYPPMFNLVTVAYFALAGESVIVGRLVSVTFTLLSMLVVYQIARKMYGVKTSLLSALMFAVMPGIIWLSRVAMIETMLIFAFTFSMLFFFKWLQTNRNRDIAISIEAFVIGIVVKYQILVVAPVIILVSLLVLGKTDRLKTEAYRFVHSKRLIWGVVLAALAAFLLYEFYVYGLMQDWLYAIQVGNPGQSVYSTRFPIPIFYLIEMTSPYSNIHPVSLLLFALGFAGLTLFAFRRKPQDKFLLIWFFSIYVIFTLISNRQWRYVTPLFPVLAISAAEFVAATYGKAQKTWQSAKNSLTKKRLAQFAAVLLIAFTAVGFFYSAMDAYTWVAQEQIQVPIGQATNYAASIAKGTQSVIVLCPVNLFSNDMVWFYLNQFRTSQTPVYQYPNLAVDAYTPEFTANQFVNYCQTNGTRCVLLYEDGGNSYFNSTLNEQAVYGMLNSTGRFTLQATFGKEPDRIFVMSFK